MDFVTPLLGLLVPHLPGLLRKAAEDVVGEGAKNVVFAAVPTIVSPTFPEFILTTAEVLEAGR